MNRKQIEAMKPDGVGWDAALPGPIADTFWHRYVDADGTGYAILDKQEKFKTGCTERGEPWSDWKDLLTSV